MSTLVDEIVVQLRRGECSARKRHEAPCATCDAVDRRIAHVLALDETTKAAVDFRARFGDSLVLGTMHTDERGGWHFIATPDPIKERLDAALKAAASCGKLKT